MLFCVYTVTIASPELYGRELSSSFCLLHVSVREEQWQQELQQQLSLGYHAFTCAFNMSDYAAPIHLINCVLGFSHNLRNHVLTENAHLTMWDAHLTMWDESSLYRWGNSLACSTGIVGILRLLSSI